MNFMGMGPWMIGKLSTQYNVAKPVEPTELTAVVASLAATE